MSFRAAYYSFKGGRRTSRPQSPIRDLTPEQRKKQLDNYYIQQRKSNKG